MAEHTKPVPHAKPFLKWAGGKTQLLDEFYKRLPEGLGEKVKLPGMSSRSSAVGRSSFILHRKFSFEKCCIGDANEELILDVPGDSEIRKKVNR